MVIFVLLSLSFYPSIASSLYSPNSTHILFIILYLNEMVITKKTADVQLDEQMNERTTVWMTEQKKKKDVAFICVSTLKSNIEI